MHVGWIFLGLNKKVLISAQFVRFSSSKSKYLAKIISSAIKVYYSLI